MELISLAVYGLDYPRIPARLVDFRKGLNPKSRELSRYAVDDVARHPCSFPPMGPLTSVARLTLIRVSTTITCALAQEKIADVPLAT